MSSQETNSETSPRVVRTPSDLIKLDEMFQDYMHHKALNEGLWVYGYERYFRDAFIAGANADYLLSRTSR